MFEGQPKVRYSHEGNLWRRFNNFLLGTRSFTEKATVGSSRDYDLFYLRVFAKASAFSRDMTALFSERQPKRGYPRGAYVHMCSIQLFFIFLLG